MGVDLLPGEHVLWAGRPAKRTVFLRHDPRWMLFSLKFDAIGLLAVVAVVAVPALWTGEFDTELFRILVIVFLAPEAVRFVEPFIWRYRTLRRTTYYVTNQRVVSIPRRRARSVRLKEIDYLGFSEEPDGTGYVRLDGRLMPDGYGNGTVAELLHVPDVREVVTLLSTLTDKPANEH
ncbi:PH domain-containing protein [Lentzea sp. NPDC003310]|uniref:PH domain-containing protein n=1 Tax=Lentzea sp. NPDC003310 TaxID=3154447 RepID=UPI0033B3CAE3